MLRLVQTHRLRSSDCYENHELVFRYPVYDAQTCSDYYENHEVRDSLRIWRMTYESMTSFKMAQKMQTVDEKSQNSDSWNHREAMIMKLCSAKAITFCNA